MSAFDRARNRARSSPIQPRLPILIGGGGEKVTLRLVALHADVFFMGHTVLPLMQPGITASGPYGYEGFRPDRHVSIDPAGDRTRYSDRIEIDAGPLTPLVAGYAQLFYRYRQRRWRRLARTLH